MTAPEQMYLICKHGGYYRPNCQGYTSSIAEAGRYTLAEAISETHPNGPDGPRDGMSYIPAHDLAAVPAQVPEGAAHIIEYTNWRGETARRTIRPISMWWGKTEWHPEEQWMLTAYDCEKDAVRDFAWQDMRPVPNPATSVAAAIEPQPDPRDEVIARLVEALTIAANRLQRCAVDYDTGSHEFLETSEWAQEARAALAAAKAVQHG